MSTTTPPITALKRNALGVPAILFFVFSAQAPLTGIVGAAGVAVALGNGAGAPGAYLIVGLVIILFAVGFTTITRHIDARGGFFAIISAGLGRRAGGGGSWLALLSYNTIQAAMYGLFGATLAGLVSQYTGLDVPWWLAAAAAIALVWFLGSRGIEVGARVLAVLVVLEVLLLLAFAFGVLFTSGPGNLDASASFSPRAVLSGAPGIAIMFGIASMFGFESTAIFSPEAKDPRKTVPRATYIAVVSIAVFFAFVMWMLISYYGAHHAQQAALKYLATSPDQFVLVPLDAVLGPWAGAVAQILLCTSLLAGLLAFHNMVTRYFHAMAGEGTLPEALERTNRFHAPAIASTTQTIVAAVLIAPFALFRLEPLTTLFAWLSGLSVAALVVLYVLSSIAILAFFQRHRVERNPWTTRIAPAVTIVLTLGELYLIVANFSTLAGSSTLLGWLLLAAVPVVFIIGWATARRALAPATAIAGADLA
jgi:amino acid transporter